MPPLSPAGVADAATVCPLSVAAPKKYKAILPSHRRRREIRISNAGGRRVPLTPAATSEWHADHWQWLDTALEGGDGGLVRVGQFRYRRQSQTVKQCSYPRISYTASPLLSFVLFSRLRQRHLPGRKRETSVPPKQTNSKRHFHRRLAVLFSDLHQCRHSTTARIAKQPTAEKQFPPYGTTAPAHVRP